MCHTKKYDKIQLNIFHENEQSTISIMLIQKESKSEKKIQCRIRIAESIYNEITAYCNWADIKMREYFIEQCCKYVFTQDEEWKKVRSAEISKLPPVE